MSDEQDKQAKYNQFLVDLRQPITEKLQALVLSYPDSEEITAIELIHVILVVFDQDCLAKQIELDPPSVDKIPYLVDGAFLALPWFQALNDFFIVIDDIEDLMRSEGADIDLWKDLQDIIPPLEPVDLAISEFVMNEGIQMQNQEYRKIQQLGISAYLENTVLGLTHENPGVDYEDMILFLYRIFISMTREE